MSPIKSLSKKRSKSKNFVKCNKLKKGLNNYFQHNRTDSVCKKFKKLDVFKMCSSVNPVTPSTMLGPEKELANEMNNPNKSEEIVCLGTQHVGTVNNNCAVKRKRETENSIEIVCEIIPKKIKLQNNKSVGLKINAHKSSLLDVGIPRKRSKHTKNKKIDTVNIDESTSVCDIDDDDDDVIVIDDTATAPIDSTIEKNKLCSPNVRKGLTVSDIIPHYNDKLLDFIPLESSTPKQNIMVQNINNKCKTSNFQKRKLVKCKINSKVLIEKKVQPQLQSTATAVSSQNQVNTASTSSLPNEFGNNFYNPNHENINKSGLRPIIIDGSNVAMGHTSGKFFSWKGLIICINYFLKLGHLVRAFVPRFRKGACTPDLIKQVESLEDSGNVVFTPSRRVEGRLIISYDDRYIVQCAAELGGVIVSTDNYNDLLQENQGWKETIEKRLLMFTWIGDMLMFPQDPLGRFGPSLEEFLRFPKTKL